MNIEQESSIRVEAIKAEQDELKKFKMYMEYLKEKTGKSGAGDLLKINFETLTDSDLVFYKKVVAFLKSLNENNCDVHTIQTTCGQFIKEGKSLSQSKLLEWFINSLSMLLYAEYLLVNWDGNGDEEKSISKFLNASLNYLDPENLF